MDGTATIVAIPAMSTCLIAVWMEDNNHVALDLIGIGIDDKRECTPLG